MQFQYQPDMTEVSDNLNDIERLRSYSGSLHTNRNRAPRIATVKPLSKSFSEDDLLKATRNDVPRVFSRLKIQDLSALKKDSLIGKWLFALFILCFISHLAAPRALI